MKKFFRRVMMLVLGLKMAAQANELHSAEVLSAEEVGSQESLQSKINKANLLLDKAMDYSENTIEKHLILSSPQFILTFAIKMAQGEFMEAYQTAVSMEELRADLGNLAEAIKKSSGKGENWHPDSVFIPLDNILHQQANALLSAVGYGGFFLQTEKPEQLEKAEKLLIQAMDLIQKEPPAKSKRSQEIRDRDISRLQADRAHVCFLQGRELEAQQWLDRMIRHGGDGQAHEELRAAQRLQKSTGVKTGYADFLLREVAFGIRVSAAPPREKTTFIRL